MCVVWRLISAVAVSCECLAFCAVDLGGVRKDKIRGGQQRRLVLQESGVLAGWLLLFWWRHDRFLVQNGQSFVKCPDTVFQLWCCRALFLFDTAVFGFWKQFGSCLGCKSKGAPYTLWHSTQ